MREAAIDIGTNTMLLLVADVQAPSGQRRIELNIDDQIDFVRLGQGVHQNKAFAPEAMDRALRAFQKYRALCDQHRVEKIHAVATSASRDSKNAPAFYEKVKNETGINVEIIDGETEARLSFLGGLLPFQDPLKTAIMDIGGGSTEFVTLAKHGEKVRGQSIDMGSVRATEIFLKGDPYTKSSLEALEAGLKSEWLKLGPDLCKELKHKDWTGIAGTATTLAGLALGLQSFNTTKIDGYRLDRCAVGDWYESLAIQTNSQRASEPIIGSGRSDIMVAGVAILYTAMELFDKNDVLVSSRGLRHGLLLEPLQ